MNQGKRNARREEGLPREVSHHDRILASREKKRWLFELGCRFPKNEDRLGLELGEVIDSVRVSFVFHGIKFFLWARRSFDALRDRLQQLSEAFVLVVKLGVNDEIGTIRLFKPGVLTCEILYLSRVDFGIKSLGISLCAGLVGGTYIDFEKVVISENGASQRTQLVVRGDKRRDRHDPGLGKQLGDLGNSPDILETVLVGEAEILIQTRSDIVPIEDFHEIPLLVEATLEEIGEGRFPGARQTIHPDDNSSLRKERLLGLSGQHLVEDGINMIEIRTHQKQNSRSGA
jgi:hypothetical protein